MKRGHSLEVVGHRAPILRQVHFGTRAGGAQNGELARLRPSDALGIVAPPGSFQHLQVPPLSNDPHEFLVTRFELPGTSVVGEAVEGLVVVEHRNLPLE